MPTLDLTPIQQCLLKGDWVLQLIAEANQYKGLRNKSARLRLESIEYKIYEEARQAAHFARLAIGNWGGHTLTDAE